MGNYKGPRWPFERHLLPKVDFNKDRGTLVDCYLAWDRAQGLLRREFDGLAAAIDANPDLTESGKQKARRDLVAAFRQRDDMQRHVENIDKARKRVEELRAQLTARPQPEGETPYQAVARAHSEDRAIRRYESLPPDQRREVLRRAIAARDTGFLGPLHRESGLLGERDAARVEAVLLEGADPKTFSELVELGGRFDPDGRPDPTTSAVAVAGFALDALGEHMDEWAGLSRAAEDVRAKLEQQLKTAGPALVLSEQEARSPQAYRMARDMAAQANRILTIEGIEGTGDIAPASANGAGGAGS